MQPSVVTSQEIENLYGQSNMLENNTVDQDNVAGQQMEQLDSNELDTAKLWTMKPQGAFGFIVQNGEVVKAVHGK